MPDDLARAHEASGKVRELYRYGDTILMVASDRISAFDVIMPTPIPHKGRVLTALSRFWFDQTTHIVPNHMISILPEAFAGQAAEDPDLIGRSMLVQRLTMLPIECVVRGYLAGSGWKDYQATGAVCGHSLPSGLRESDRLPSPIFTPATKNTEGHDINIDRATAQLLIGEERVAKLEELSLAVYEAGAAFAQQRGLILADTKMEFGIDLTGELGAGRRAADAGLVAVLAGRRLRARRPPAVVRQAVRARPPGDARLGQDAARAGAAARGRRGHAAPLLRGLRAARRGAVRGLSATDGSDMKVTVLVRPRDGILDPQGEAVRRSLAGLGYPAADVRAGKVFDLDVEGGDEEQVRRIAGEIAEKVLSNPLIEQYEVELVGA